MRSSCLFIKDGDLVSMDKGRGGADRFMIQPDEVIGFLPIRGHENGRTTLGKSFHYLDTLGTGAARHSERALRLGRGGTARNLHSCTFCDEHTRLFRGCDEP